MFVEKKKTFNLSDEEAQVIMDAYHIIHDINNEMAIFDVFEFGTCDVDKDNMNCTEIVLYAMRNMLINGNRELTLN